MKTKRPMGKQKAQPGGSLKPACWALARLWRANANLAVRGNRKQAMKGYTAGLRDCADLLEEITGKPNERGQR